MNSKQLSQTDLKHFFTSVLSSQQNYHQNSKKYYQDSQTHFLYSSQKIKIALSSSYNMLKEPKLQPIQKKLCMVVLKDLLQMQHKQLTKILQKTLNEVLKIATYQSQKPEQQRGELYFDSENQQLGVDIVRLATEFICFGNQVYPQEQDGKDSQFQTMFLKLVEAGIQTDIEFQHFSANNKGLGQSNMSSQLAYSNISNQIALNSNNNQQLDNKNSFQNQNNNYQNTIGEPVHEDDYLNKVHDSLQEFEMAKQQLKQIFHVNDIECFEFGVCNNVCNYMKDYIEQIQNQIQYLLTQTDSVSDQYVQQVFGNSDFANNFVEKYQNYHGQQISFQQFVVIFQEYFNIDVRGNQDKNKVFKSEDQQNDTKKQQASIKIQQFYRTKSTQKKERQKLLQQQQHQQQHQKQQQQQQQYILEQQQMQMEQMKYEQEQAARYIQQKYRKSVQKEKIKKEQREIKEKQLKQRRMEYELNEGVKKSMLDSLYNMNQQNSWTNQQNGQQKKQMNKTSFKSMFEENVSYGQQNQQLKEDLKVQSEKKQLVEQLRQNEVLINRLMEENQQIRKQNELIIQQNEELKQGNQYQSQQIDQLQQQLELLSSQRTNQYNDEKSVRDSSQIQEKKVFNYEVSDISQNSAIRVGKFEKMNQYVDNCRKEDNSQHIQQSCHNQQSYQQMQNSLNKSGISNSRIFGNKSNCSPVKNLNEQLLAQSNRQQNQFCQNNDSINSQKSNSQSIRLSDLRNQNQKMNRNMNGNGVIINDKYISQRSEVINETFEEKFDNDQSMLQRKEKDREHELKQQYPLDKNLIFPYQKAQEYYQNQQKQKTDKYNIVEYNPQLFVNVENIYLQRQDKNNLIRFKLSCLKNKYPIYENDFIQIGFQSIVQMVNNQQQVRIMLYFGNKNRSNEISHLQQKFNGDINIQVWSKPNQIDNRIAPKNQIKQELIVQFNQLPYEIVSQSLNYFVTELNQQSSLSYCLPLTLNKFMNEVYIEKQEFIYKWEELKQQNKVWSSREFEMNEKIAGNVYDVKRHFKSAVDLSQNKEYEYIQGLSHYKLGCQLSICKVDIYLKMVIKPAQKIQLLVGVFSHQNTSLVQYLLNTLVFILKRD